MGAIYSDGTYLENNSDWHQEDSPYKASLVAKAISRTNSSFTSCVDVGCGAGAIANILSEQFPDRRFYGYDISKDAAAFWARTPQSAVDFRCADLLGTAEKFDLALCLDVFEHVEDYIGFLNSLRKNADQFIFNIPLDMNVAKLVTGIRHAREHYGHLHYFNSYTALATLEHCGYVIQDYYFSAPFKSTRPKSIKQALILIPRLLMSAFGPKIAAGWFGGYSLVVTAKPKR